MKVAIIGAGFGRYAMAPVYEKLGFQVEVVTPRDAEAVARVIASDADLVSIHSPPFMQHDHVMQALDHGHAVLCDKPFGLDAAQARAMRDRARAMGALNFLNFEVRSKPSRAKMKALVDEGAIGRPLHLNWTFFSNGFRHGPHGWVNERELGGGWINAYASHCIDFTRWVFASEVARCGGISRIEMKTHPDADGRPHPATAEDAYSAWFVMQNGCTANQDTAYCAAAPMPMRVTLMGDEGGLELVGDTRLILRRAAGDASLSAAERIRLGLLAGEGDAVFEFPPAPGEAHEPALMPWLEQVRDALVAGAHTGPSFDDGVAVAEVLEQLRGNFIVA
jgi:predicted dehydrogenase